MVVDSLESTSQTYNDAKELLEKAFLDIDLQNFKAMKQVVELKLGPSDDPYCFISKLRNAHESVRLLNLTVDHFLQFFLWEGINNKFRQQITNIVNKNYPTLQEILDNYFSAIERVSFVEKSVKMQSGVDTFGMAVNIDNNKVIKSPICYVCSELDDKNLIILPLSVPTFLYLKIK